MSKTQAKISTPLFKSHHILTFSILIISLYSTDHNKLSTQATTEQGEATDQTSCKKVQQNRHLIRI